MSTKINTWRAAAVAVAVASLTILDLTKINVAVPSMEEALSAGASEIQFVLAGYALAFALALVPAGRLGDMWSRKNLLLIGLSIFMVTSIICAIAPNSTVLIIGRLVQGFAAGIQMPQILGMMQQMFTGHARAKAFGIFGATIGISTAFGPTIGGALIALGGTEVGWRLIFWLNVPLIIAIFPLVITWLPQADRMTHRERQSLDPFGVVLLAVGVVTLMLPFALTSGASDDDPRRWAMLILSLLALTGFAFWERHQEQAGRTPMVRLSVLRISSFRNGALIAAMYFAAMPAIFLVTTLFLQVGVGTSAFFAGMVSIPFALASAVTSWFGGTLVLRYGRKLVMCGLVIVAIGFLLVLLCAVTLPQEVVEWAMAGGMLIAGLGGGLVISPNQTITLSEIDVVDGGVAASMGQLGQRVGNAMGIAVATAAFYAPFAGSALASASIDTYHDAIRNGFLVAIGFIAIAIIIAATDLVRGGSTVVLASR